MATIDGRRRRGDKRRERVLDAAIELATVEGLDGFSLDQLAAVSEVPKGSIQILFKNKAGLQRSVVLAARRTVHTRVLLPTAEVEPAIDRLLRFGELWLEYMVATRDRGGCFFSAVWAEFQSKPGPLHDLVSEDRRNWLDGLTAAVEQGIEAGDLNSTSSASEEAVALLGLGVTANAELQYSRTAGDRDLNQGPGRIRARALWVNQVERLR